MGISQQWSNVHFSPTGSEAMGFSGPSCVCAVTKRNTLGLSPRYNFPCNHGMDWVGRECKDQLIPSPCRGYESLPGVATHGMHSEFVL